MMLSTFMVLFTTIISTVDCACSYCDRCVDDKCMDPDNNRCLCVKGCKPGYYSGRCGNTCPEQCVSCGREYGKVGDPTYNLCYECTDGYHNGNSTNCLCPLKCQQCTSTTTCTVCNSGRYGGVCASPCPQDCRDNVCSITDGYCTHGCVNGKYGTQCQYQCPTTCKDDECDQTGGTCHDCIPGKYGENCDSVCPSTTCFNNECDRRIGTCTNGCMSNYAPGENTLCDVCIPGKYGQNCATDCPTTKCLNNECHRENGKCLHGCVKGYYNEQCNNNCSGNCFGGICDQYAGKCSKCITGYHGDKCDKTCSNNCVNNTCSQDVGKCIDGCTDGFQGQYCSEDNSCNQHTGKCDGCISGYHGDKCDKHCSKQCVNNTCTQDGGICTNGSTDDSRDKHCLNDNDKESQTSLPIGGAIVVGIALVCSVIANVILVIYLLHKRRQAKTKTETHEMIQNIGQHTYANDFIDDEEPSEVHVYEGLDENRLEDKTTYSTPDPVNV